MCYWTRVGDAAALFGKLLYYTSCAPSVVVRTLTECLMCLIKK